jgi:hypothetical protein
LINKNYNNEKRHFDIVVPSIPGYAFSTPLKKPNDVVDTARLYDGLMRHLFGNDCKYFVHGEGEHFTKNKIFGSNQFNLL